MPKLESLSFSITWTKPQLLVYEFVMRNYQMLLLSVGLKLILVRVRAGLLTASHERMSKLWHR